MTDPERPSEAKAPRPLPDECMQPRDPVEIYKLDRETVDRELRIYWQACAILHRLETQGARVRVMKPLWEKFITYPSRLGPSEDGEAERILAESLAAIVRELPEEQHKRVLFEMGPAGYREMGQVAADAERRRDEMRIERDSLAARVVELERHRDEEHERAWQNRGVDDPCKKCSGLGVYSYGSTATWRGGFGGQMITVDVCDACWGSGDEHRHGADLRKMTARIAALEAELSSLRAVAEASGQLIAERGKIQKRTTLHDALEGYHRVLAERQTREPRLRRETAAASSPCPGCSGMYLEGQQVMVLDDGRVMHPLCAQRAARREAEQKGGR